jgi:hypothetical protein
MTKKASNFLGQPCVKFIIHSLSYFAFSIFLIVSSLQFVAKEDSTLKFSTQYPQYVQYLEEYSQRTDLKHRFFASDFYIRDSTASELDYVITVWIIGTLFEQLYYRE